MLTRISKRFIAIAGVAIVLLGAGGFAYYRQVYLPSQTEEEPEVQTATARRGDILVYASGSGTLAAADEAELGFGVPGLIAALHVQVGDKVNKDDVLAVQGDLEQLEAVVAANQLALLEAQQALDELYEGAAQAASEAQLALANARQALDDAQDDWTLNQPGNRATPEEMKSAQAKVVLAEKRRQNKQRALDNAHGKTAKANAQIALTNAIDDYQSAVWYLQWLQEGATELEMAVLGAELEQAQVALEVAEREWERVKDGPDPIDVAKLELALANAEAELALSQRDLDEAVIVAPSDGTILGLTADEGDEVSAAFITMADLNQRYVEVHLDETDTGLVGVGHSVEVIFDALPDLTFTGQIVQVDPSLQSSGQVTTIRALAELDQFETARPDGMLLGMNAAVDVIAGQAVGVVLAPVEALRELEPGEYAVFVMEAGEPRLRMVEVGLMDFTFAEIKSGLDAGEVVTTGIVETQG